MLVPPNLRGSSPSSHLKHCIALPHHKGACQGMVESLSWHFPISQLGLSMLSSPCNARAASLPPQTCSRAPKHSSFQFPCKSWVPSSYCWWLTWQVLFWLWRDVHKTNVQMKLWSDMQWAQCMFRVEQVSSPLRAPGQERLLRAWDAEAGFKGGEGVQMRREEYGEFLGRVTSTCKCVYRCGKAWVMESCCICWRGGEMGWRHLLKQAYKGHGKPIREVQPSLPWEQEWKAFGRQPAHKLQVSVSPPCLQQTGGNLSPARQWLSHIVYLGSFNKTRVEKPPSNTTVLKLSSLGTSSSS